MSRARAFGLGLVLAAGALFHACGSSKVEGERGSAAIAAGARTAAAEGAPAGRVTIRGTAIDAASGKPVKGALIEGPEGARAYSDRDGRFELDDLPLGASGELLASTEDGRRGQNALRPLRAGTLEVVVFLR